MEISLNIKSLKPLVSNVETISSKLTFSDLLGSLKVRFGIGRNNYSVLPGLYKIGNPDCQSDVFVSANYKLSFDVLRKNLDSFNAWILVIDTKGVNVWCAAGKGTFGTDNVVKSIKSSSLEHIVKHRKIILPQLSASGVAAYKVKEQTGFKAIFGPVQAKDIKPYVEAGYKATSEMRKINFSLKERAKLIPVDFMYAIYKLLLIMFLFFILSGLDRTGLLFEKMLNTSLFPLINIFGGYFAGVVIATLFLPFIPFRAFAIKGACGGIALTILLNLIFKVSALESIGMGLINISIASFMTMNFTGSSTYTSFSGVKKEMKWAIPFQIGLIFLGTIIYIISKLV